MKKRSLILSILFLLIIISSFDFIGEMAPDFTAKDIDGKDIRLSNYRGKIVLLDFWASWCGPCQQEFPFLIDFYNNHKNENFIVLAVNIDNEKENMLNFLRKNYMREKFPVIFDPEKKVPPIYDIQAMPTSIFIDKKGTIRYVHNGYNESSKKEFKKELTTLLSEK